MGFTAEGSPMQQATIGSSVVFAGGGTGLGGPVDPRQPARPGFIPEPSRAGCGCLVLTLLVAVAFLLLVTEQWPWS